ncbi:MAG: RNA methyltransferase [Anaerolineae bacterium]|nr:RNA methyltransferase [Anaerolineae bacterium]
MITSSQNPKLKLVRALGGRSKVRRKEGAFLAEGVRLLEEAQAAKWPFRFVLFSDGLSERGQTLIEKLRFAGCEVEEVESHLFQSASETDSPQGILAVLDQSQLPIPKSPNLILILDQMRDPGNLGSLIRTATAAGVQAVLLPPETADAYSPKVVRSGMGAHFRIPIHSLGWEDIKIICKDSGLQVILADMDGQPYWKTDFHRPLALIVGGEMAGASEPARNLADTNVSIPMTGKTESLNASVAGAILMYEVVRQRS